MAEEVKDAASASDLEPAQSISEEEETAPAPAPEESTTLVIVERREQQVPLHLRCSLPFPTKKQKSYETVRCRQVCRDRWLTRESCTTSDAFLTRVVTEKRMSMIKAWEENEKAKAENRAARRLAGITSWENSKIAQMEAELKKIHEQLEMKKAAQAEKLRNAAAAARRAAEEKRAAAMARRGEEVVRAEEAAERYRARGQAPTTTSLFGGGGGLFGTG